MLAPLQTDRLVHQLCEFTLEPWLWGCWGAWIWWDACLRDAPSSEVATNPAVVNGGDGRTTGHMGQLSPLQDIWALQSSLFGSLTFFLFQFWHIWGEDSCLHCIVDISEGTVTSTHAISFIYFYSVWIILLWETESVKVILSPFWKGHRQNREQGNGPWLLVQACHEQKRSAGKSFLQSILWFEMFPYPTTASFSAGHLTQLQFPCYLLMYPSWM